MSGGPVIAVIGSSTAFKFGVIGVQSAWYSEARIIAACPFASFGAALEPIVEEALREWEKMGND